MMIACTNRYTMKVFNLSSTTTPISPSYSLTFDSELPTWPSWDVN